MHELDDDALSLDEALVRLKATDPAVRQVAVLALGELCDLRERRAIPDLIGAARDSDASVRRLALGALSFFGDAALVDVFVRGLGDPDWQVRQEAAIVLGRAGDAAAAPALAAALDDPY